MSSWGSHEEKISFYVEQNNEVVLSQRLECLFSGNKLGATQIRRLISTQGYTFRIELARWGYLGVKPNTKIQKSDKIRPTWSKLVFHKAIAL